MAFESVKKITRLSINNAGTDVTNAVFISTAIIFIEINNNNNDEEEEDAGNNDDNNEMKKLGVQIIPPLLK